MSAESIKKSICDALSNLDGQGSFSCSGLLDACSNPALSIKGLGTVGLPLSGRDAQAIATSSVTQQSPFGKGSETLVDTKVRKSWQIDPKDFQLRNQHFDFQVNHVVTKAVAKKLGVACGPANIRAQLYKLLLYDEGAFFLPHQDGEKAEGMFGTLMICLPSEHTGGEVHLSHDGRQHIVKTSETSGFEYSYAAWYADVTHEVKPVTSGKRLVLIYNLIQRGSGPRPTASTSTDAKSRLTHVLAQWNSLSSDEDSEVPCMLAYKLSYMYSKANLSFDSLKGSDDDKFRLLCDSCSDQDVDLYLARIKKEVQGGCEEYGYGGGLGGRFSYDYAYGESDCEDEEDEDDEDSHGHVSTTGRGRNCHEITEEYESSIELTQVIDQNRATIAEGVEFDVEDIAQGDIFSRDPDDEDYSGYTGNEGVSATHYYHNTVALLVPRRRRSAFQYKVAKSGPGGISLLLQSLQKDLKSSADSSKRSELERFCRLAIEENKTTRSSGSGAYGYWGLNRGVDSPPLPTAIAAAALDLDDVLLLEETVQTLSGEPPLEIFVLIREAIPRLGFDTLKPALENFLKHRKQIQSICSALQAVCEQAPQSHKQAKSTPGKIEEWTKVQVEWMLSKYPPMSATDGTSLIDISRRLGADLLEQKIAPYAESRAADTDFAVAFLTRLFEIRDDCHIASDSLRNVYGKVATALIEHLKLGVIEQRASSNFAWQRNYGIREPYSSSKPSSMAAHTLLILQHCEALSLENQVTLLFSRVLTSALTSQREVLEHVHVPYLTLLLTHLRNQSSLSVLSNDCCRHFHLILQSYIIRAVGHEPRRPLNFRRPENMIRCSCGDCRLVQAFILDNNKSTLPLRMALSRRKHLEKQISSKDLEHHTITSGSPYTLVIKKAFAAYIDQLEQWQQRFNQVSKVIRELDSNPWLRRLLGNYHDEIVNLKVRDRPMPTLAPCLTGNQPLNPDPSVGNKRKEAGDSEAVRASKSKRPKVEVIDLSSD